MRFEAPNIRAAAPNGRRLILTLAAALFAGACATTGPEMSPAMNADRAEEPAPVAAAASAVPDPDPRVGLEPGLFDAEQALWNLELVSATPPADDFVGVTNSDLAFKGPYAIQGNYNGFMVWDISDPSSPELVTDYLCPASQSDVSVYEDLLFVSGEGLGGRLDCGTGGVPEQVSEERLRGIRIFDISDIEAPQYIANVQTCRGSHTHSVLADPDDPENVYVYVSGSAPVRPEEELPGCSSVPPDEDPSSALFRIEVIRVPLADPASAEIVSSPRIFEGLVAPPRHGLSEADRAVIEEARARGAFVAEIWGQERVLPDQFVAQLLQDVVEARGGSGDPTAADSAALRERLPTIIDEMMAARGGQAEEDSDAPAPGPTQCHDITLYPEIGLAGGACEGYGLLIDIEDPTDPVRIDAVADSNFAYWHSATFNNDGSKVLFTDEWGGGGGPKCRAGDPYEWGADAIFTIEDGTMDFRSYYKMPAVQTSEENCVAHNGSLIPIPGRDVMVQAWYQGGVSVFDWTDPDNPVEIAFFDRGPVDGEQMESGGSWSAYWYNGVIVSSEIARGLDILELTPSPYLTTSEIEAARTATLGHFNVQGQQKFDWPATFALARAYTDQLERSGALGAERIAGVRQALAEAEDAPAAKRRSDLRRMADHLEEAAGTSGDAAKVRLLARAVRDLAG